MGHTQDFWEGFRRWLIPKLGVVTLILEEITGEEYYVEYELRDTELVGRVPMPEEEFERFLHEQGFERNPWAALKRRASTREVEEGSWRKVGYDENPEKQLHLVLYDGDETPDADTGYTLVYAHWEYRWDVHPFKHYRGVDYDPKEGVLRTRKILDEAGVDYTFEQP